MLTNEGVNNMWRTHVAARYNKLERARPWGITPDAKRFLVWLWVSCERLAPDEPDKLFSWALEQLADACQLNVLQPAAPTELKAPDQWRDPWNNPLPNPWVTGDLQGQSLLTKRDPQLASWLKAFAKSPYLAASEWADTQAKLLKQKALSYDADSHQANIFANPNASETDKALFVLNAPPEVIEQCRREAKEIEFPTAKNFNLTAQSKIATIPRLSALWDSMVEEERQYVTAEKAALSKQRTEAEMRLKALEAGDTPQQPRPQRAMIGSPT
jgi:hypothetical protein